MNQEKSRAADLVTEIEGQQKKLKEMQKDLHLVLSSSTKLQSFLGLYQIEQQVHKSQRYVESLGNDDRGKQIEIKIRQNDVIENILSKLESLESLGEVMVVKKETALNRETSLSRNA